MKRNRMKWTALAGVLVLASASHASAQRVTEQRVQELIRQAAAAQAGQPALAGQPPAAGQPGQPGQAGTAARPGSGQPTVAMTLDDAIKLALDRNLDIAVQRLNPQTYDFSIANLRAIYRPTVSSSINRVSQTDPSRSTTQ